MKNIYKFFTITLLAGAMFSCDTEPDNLIYDLIDENVQHGAILRTLALEGELMNSSDPSSTFSVTVEEQDAEDGNLLQNVELYVSIQDRTSDNGTTSPSRALVKAVDASAFSKSQYGFPTATISMTFGEAVSAMGLTSEQYAAGDVFYVELTLNLTDGRSFGSESSSAALTGNYFKSPFAYNVLLTCSPEPGDYLVKMWDSYGDGWQTDGGNGGHGIQVTLDDGTVIEVGMCSPYEASPYTCTGPASTSFFEAEATVSIPDGTGSASWYFPGDNWGEIRFEVYAPDGSLVFDSGDYGETGAGLLPIVVCAAE